MKTETLRRWLWRVFLFWTAAGFVVLAGDVGPAQIRLWIAQPGLRDFFLGIMRAADAVWMVLAATNMYFYLIEQEGLRLARRAALTILIGVGAVICIGLRTGFPFGPVVFTQALGAKIGGVPFSVPLLWLALIVAARYSVLHVWEHARRWQIAVGTGLLVATTDLGLEWIAWRIRAWWLWYFPLANTPEWPPVQNYLAWFVLATALAWLAFPAARPVGRHWRPVVLLALVNLLCWLSVALRLGR